MTHSFQTAAAALLADQRDRLPDLSGVTVLVPHHHVRAPFVAALRGEVGDGRVFLPPRLLTLPALAALHGQGDASGPDNRRLVDLYGFLAGIEWLDEAAL